MTINDKLLIADPGYLIRRISNREILGNEYCCGYIYYDKDGKRLPEPYLETADEFDQVSEESVYSGMVVSFIRTSYSLDDELAIQRQRDEKPGAFQKYFDFCEECKKEVRERMERGDYNTYK